jgi:glycosyltransferase involved in cell wall biosynthesis
MRETRLLFVTRNYPPRIGGMEKYAYDLYHALKSDLCVDLLKHDRGKLYLPFFIIRCLLFLLVRGKRYTHIHFGDAVLSPLAWIAKQTTHARISTTVHALDVIYNNRVYQFIVPRCLARLDRIVAVSRYTLEQCVQRGVRRERCYVIPNGINLNEIDIPVPALETLADKYHLNVTGKKILFSIGRLIRRKGIHWFVEQVMPMLDEQYIYVIAGDGPESPALSATVRRLGLGGRVYLLGGIPDADKYCLYRHAELFIMSNIPVPGDAEGFGITVIEAAACGLPAVVANLEGIPDTIIDGVTGTLVQAGNAGQFAGAIRQASFDRDQIARRVRARHDWVVLKTDYIKHIFN